MVVVPPMRLGMVRTLVEIGTDATLNDRRTIRIVRVAVDSTSSDPYYDDYYGDRGYTRRRTSSAPPSSRSSSSSSSRSYRR